MWFAIRGKLTTNNAMDNIFVRLRLTKNCHCRRSFNKMILIRALFNGTVSLVVFFAITSGIMTLLHIIRIKFFPAEMIFLIGGISIILVLFYMSRLQKRALDLSKLNIIIQNILSLGFIACCLIPMK